jgi:hypothetical protein
VNHRMSDLLDRASDDGGAPLGFSGDGVLRRARVSRRRRHGFAAIGLTAAGVAGVLVATQLAGQSRARTQDPASGPGATALQTASSSPARALTPQERAITAQCARLHLPAPPVGAPRGQGGMHLPSKGAKIQDSDSSGPSASFLTSWTIDAYAQDDHGVTATFVNPAHTRWASCDVATRGIDDGDQIWTAPLPTGPVPSSWYGPGGFRHQGSTVSWWQVCAAGEGEVCGHELFAGALVRYAGVASARVDAPDGTVLTPVFGRYTYVFRHVEARVDPHRAADDLQTLPSMPVTLLSPRGQKVIRYDYFPAYLVPDGCPSSGGC